MEIEDLKLELQKSKKKVIGTAYAATNKFRVVVIALPFFKMQSKEMEHDSRIDARENMAKMREESLIAELENLANALESERAK